MHDGVAVEVIVPAAVKVKHTQGTLERSEQVAVADAHLHGIAGSLPEGGEKRYIFLIFGTDKMV